MAFRANSEIERMNFPQSWLAFGSIQSVIVPLPVTAISSWTLEGQAASAQMALQSLEDLRLQQASSLAYFDDFWLFAVLALGLVFLVPLMKRSVAEKGEHIGAE